ncbi:unnamed protein product, partial [Staurois parvus]
MTPKGRDMMGLVVLQQLEGRQFDTPCSMGSPPEHLLGDAQLLPNYKSHESLQDSVTSMTHQGKGMMGLVVLQQLEGRRFDTPARIRFCLGG